MNNDFNLIEPVGRGKGRYYNLTRYAYGLLEEEMKYERQQSLDREAIKIRILSILKERELTNKEIRQMTGLTSKQVQRLIKELKSDGVIVTGHGAVQNILLMNRWRIRTVLFKRGQNLVKGYSFDSRNEENKDITSQKCY